jgi:hypothetical protein
MVGAMSYRGASLGIMPAVTQNIHQMNCEYDRCASRPCALASTSRLRALAPTYRCFRRPASMSGAIASRGPRRRGGLFAENAVIIGAHAQGLERRIASNERIK